MENNKSVGEQTGAEWGPPERAAEGLGSSGLGRGLGEASWPKLGEASWPGALNKVGQASEEDCRNDKVAKDMDDMAVKQVMPSKEDLRPKDKEDKPAKDCMSCTIV